MLSTPSETYVSHKIAYFDTEASIALKMAFALKLGDYFVLIYVKNPYCNRVHFFRPLVIAAIAGNAKTTGFHLIK